MICWFAYAAAVLITVFPAVIDAQPYPAKAVRVVIPFPIGGNTDVYARPISAKMAELYGQLAELTPSPVIELNGAVAVAMAEGPEAGLAHRRAGGWPPRSLPPLPCRPG